MPNETKRDPAETLAVCAGFAFLPALEVEVAGEIDAAGELEVEPELECSALSFGEAVSTGAFLLGGVAASELDEACCGSAWGDSSPIAGT